MVGVASDAWLAEPSCLHHLHDGGDDDDGGGGDRSQLVVMSVALPPLRCPARAPQCQTRPLSRSTGDT